jgi:hypothetical protein
MGPEDEILDPAEQIESELEESSVEDLVEEQVNEALVGTNHDLSPFDHQSSVKEFFRTQAIKSGDPFEAARLENAALIEKLQRQDEAKLLADATKEDGFDRVGSRLNIYHTSLADYNNQVNRLTGSQAGRLRASMPDYGRSLANRSTGFLAPENGLKFRPRTEDYMSFGSSLNASRLDLAVFQVQNQELLGGWQHSGIQKLQITTQLDRPLENQSIDSWYESEKTRFNITGGNRVLEQAFPKAKSGSIQVGGGYIATADPNQRGLMHAKLGALYGEGNRLVGAFLGSQNLTSALGRTHTEEETLFLTLGRDDSHRSTRQRLIQEIADVTSGIRENFTGPTTSKGLTDRISAQLSQPTRSLSYGTNVLGSINSMLSDAVKNNSSVLLNMQYIEKFLDSGSKHQSEIYANLLELSKTRRLTVAISETSIAEGLGYYSLLDRVRAGKSNVLIDNLLVEQAFATLPTRFLHTKSLAVFSNTGELLEYGIGSQNLSNAEYTSADLNFETFLRLKDEELVATGVNLSRANLEATRQIRSSLYVDRQGSYQQTTRLINRLERSGGQNAHLFAALDPNKNFKYNVRYKTNIDTTGGTRRGALRAMSGVDIYLPTANNYRLSATIGQEYTATGKMPVVYLNTGNRIITGAVYRIAQDFEGTVNIPGRAQPGRAGDVIKLDALQVFESFIQTVIRAADYERKVRAPLLVLQEVYNKPSFNRLLKRVPGNEEDKRALVSQLNHPDNLKQLPEGSAKIIELAQAVIRADPTGRLQRMEAAYLSTGIMNVVSNISASFLQPHESIYSGGHLTAALPIFGINNSVSRLHFDGNNNNPALLNPYDLSHYDVLNGGDLDLFRGVQDSTRVRSTDWRLMEGGLYHSEGGPVKVTDIAQFSRSTKNMAVITPDTLKADFELINQALNGNYQSSLQITQNLYVLPYAKAEQISQRLKNKKSERVLLEAGNDLLDFLSSGGATTYGGELIRNNVPTDLPPEQFAIYKQILKENKGDRQKTLTKLRERQANPLTAMQGLLGASQYQNVWISAGYSLQSDFSYVNETYLDRPVVDATIKSYSFSSENIGSSVQLARITKQKLRKGTLFLAEDLDLRQAFGATADQPNALYERVAEKTLGGRWVEGTDERLKRMFFVGTDPEGETIIKLKKGVYYNETKDILGLQKIGSMNSTSLNFTLDGVEVQGREGKRLRNFALPIDNSAISRRAHEAIAVLDEDAFVSQQGPNIRLEMSYKTVFNPQTGMRTIGVKGPVYSVMESFFGNLAANRGWTDKAVAVISPGQIKDFNFGHGFELLSDEKHFLRGGTASAEDLRNFRAGLSYLIEAAKKPSAWDIYPFLDSLSIKGLTEKDLTDGKIVDIIAKSQKLTKEIYGSGALSRSAAGTVVSDPLTRGLSLLAITSSWAKDIYEQKGQFLNRSTYGDSPEIEINFNAAGLKEYNAGSSTLNKARDSIALIFGIDLKSLSPPEREAAFHSLDALYANNIMLRSKLDLSFSRIAVAMGMKTETKLEASYAMSMTEGQLKAYTYQKGGAAELQGALVMLARLHDQTVTGSTIANYYSFAEETNVLEYGKATPNERLKTGAFIASFTSNYSIYARQDLIEVEGELGKVRKLRAEPIDKLVNAFNVSVDSQDLLSPLTLSLLQRMEKYGNLMSSGSINRAAREMALEAAQEANPEKGRSNLTISKGTEEYYREMITAGRQRISSNDGSSYLEAMRSLALYSKKDSALQRDVQQSQLLHLPMLETTGEGSDVRYHLSDQWVSGARYGLDILEQISLVFHAYSSSILVEQRELQSLMTEAMQTGLLKKVMRHASTAQTGAYQGLELNASEVELYSRLVTVLGNTPKSITTLFKSKDVMRRGEGDRLKMSGTTYVGINSLLVATTDVVLGNQVERIFEKGGSSSARGLAASLLQEISSGGDLSTAALSEAAAIRTLYNAKQTATGQSPKNIEKGFSNSLLNLAKKWSYTEKGDLSEQNLQLEFYGLMLSRPGETINSQEQSINELYRVANQVRTGAPYGVAGSAAVLPVYSQSIDALRAAGDTTGTILKPGRHNSTAMIASTLSHMYTQLGDYDGDTFQVAFPAMVEKLAKIKYTKMRLASLNASFVAKENLKAELLSLRTQHTEAISELAKHISHFAGKEDEAIRKFTARFYGFEESLLTDVSREEMQHLSLQFRGTLSGSDKGAKYVNQGWELTKKLIDASRLNDQQANLEQTKLQDIALDDSLKTELTTALNKGKNPNDFKEIQNLTIKQYITQLQISKNVEFAQANVVGMLRSAIATPLNSVELETLGAVVGTTGMGMLGVTYNAVTPLLEIVRGSEMSRLALSDRPELIDSLFTALDKKPLGPRYSADLVKELDLRVGIAHTFSLTTQQFMRDAALKPKQGGGVLDLAAAYKLSEKLRDASGVGNLRDTRDEKSRRLAVETVLRTFINTQVGSQLETDSTNKYTAFAALTLVNEYLGSIKSAESIETKGALSNYLKGRRAAYESEGSSLSSDQLIAKEIVNLHNKFKVNYLVDHVLETNNSVNGGLKKVVSLIKGLGDEYSRVSSLNADATQEQYLKAYFEDRFSSDEYQAEFEKLLLQGKRFSSELQKIAAGETSLHVDLATGANEYLAAMALHNRTGGDQASRLNLVRQIHENIDLNNSFYQALSGNDQSAAQSALAVAAVTGILPTQIEESLRQASPEKRAAFFNNESVKEYLQLTLSKSGAMSKTVESTNQIIRTASRVLESDNLDEVQIFSENVHQQFKGEPRSSGVVELESMLQKVYAQSEPQLEAEFSRRRAQTEQKVRTETTRLVTAHRKSEILSILAVPTLLATLSGHTLKPEEVGSLVTNVFQAGLMATSYNNSAVGRFLAPERVDPKALGVVARADAAMQYARLREFVRSNSNPITGTVTAAAFEYSARAMSHAAALVIQRAAPKLAESGAGRGVSEVLGGLLGMAVGGVLTDRPITGLNSGMGSVVAYAAQALQSLQTSLQEAQTKYMSSYLDAEDSTEISLSVSGEGDLTQYPSELELQAKAGWDPRVELYDSLQFEGSIEIEPQSLGPDSIEPLGIG